MVKLFFSVASWAGWSNHITELKLWIYAVAGIRNKTGEIGLKTYCLCPILPICCHDLHLTMPQQIKITLCLDERALDPPMQDRQLAGLNPKTKKVLVLMLILAAIRIRIFAMLLALAASLMPAQAENGYTLQEVVDSGHSFFGSTSGGLATVIEKVFSTYGLPNGYILGEEGSGAVVGGLTYGEGTLYTKNAGDHKLFWQGPSIGWDFGGTGNRTMMLVYNLADVNQMYGRFGGVAGSAYFIAGVGFNVMKHGNVLLVPVRTGVGARLGINVGYLKLTQQPTWNPF